MIDHVLVSVLAAPVATAAAARVAADHVAPRLAVVGFTAAACLSSAASTVSLVVAGTPAAVSGVAAARHGELPTAGAGMSATAFWQSWVYAIGAVTVVALFLRAVRGQRLALRAAYSQAAALPAGDDVVVLPDERPDAFALPGSPGRIVVTDGMLAALTADQQAALLAHERAHLSSRHHWFAFAARLAAGTQPLLRPVTAVVEYSIERWADECAATDVGDRRSTARAVGTAALVARALPGPCAPAVLKAVTGHRRGGGPGPVPRRVAALLRPLPSARGRLSLVALPVAVALSSLGLTVEAFFDISC